MVAPPTLPPRSGTIAVPRGLLIALTVSLNGDPLPSELLDNFAYEIHTKFAQGEGKPSLGRRLPISSKAGAGIA